MPPTVDSYVWVFNIDGFGYSHFFIDDIKQVIDFLLKVFANTNYKIVCCYPNFVTRMAHKSLSYLMNERIKKKVVFLNEISRENFESIGLYLDSMP